MSLASVGKKLLGPKVIINAIKKENPALIGRDLAKAIDGFLDRQFGNKKSYQVEKYIIPFVQDLCESFVEELLQYNDKDRDK